MASGRERILEPMNLPANVSESTKRRNPELFGLGKLQSEKPEPKAKPALVRESQGDETRCGRMASGRPILRITLISFRARRLDSDNLAGGFKPLRDAIARWLGVDDSDSVIEWAYGQQITQGTQGTAVRIEPVWTS